MGLLLNAQAIKAENYWGSRLQITIFMCADSSPQAACVDGKATADEEAAVEAALKTNPEVADFRYETAQMAYDKWQASAVTNNDTLKQAYQAVKPSDFSDSYWVTLKDPNNFLPLETQVKGLPGVKDVRDLRTVLEPIYFWISALKWGAISVAFFLVIAAVLQVSNTIRLAALARRREIGIMRLVGASNIYIQLPFLMESLIAAVAGIAIAGLGLLGFLKFVVYDRLVGNVTLVQWVDYSDGLTAVLWVSLLGLALTLVPTLLLTRKYLKV
jgi:cell division transport system permease protein